MLVATIALQISNSSTEYASTPTAENAQSKTADDMSSHHGKQPAADSSVFDSLLGKEAPDFIPPSYKGETITLKLLLGKNVILFFNEGEMCYPSCWNQIAALNKDKPLSNNSTVSLSITVDSASV